MTHVRLLHEQRRARTAQLEELEHVESGGASKHTADASGLQTRQSLDIQFRQPLLTAPTHYTSLKRVRRIGVGGGELGELRAVPEPLDRFLGAGTPVSQLLRRRLLGYPDQNVRDVVFSRSVLSLALLEEQILDLTSVGKGCYAALQLLLHAIHPLRQLVLRDHLFVDYRDDPVDEIDARWRGRLGAGALRERRAPRDQGQYGKQKSHRLNFPGFQARCQS